MIRKNKDGFTLVELMLAMTFFSFVLLFVVSGFVQINRTYTRGVTQKDIQNAARAVVDDISDAIRNSRPNSVVVTTGGSPFRLCIGGSARRYAFNQHIGGDTTAASFSNETFASPSTEEITLARSTETGVACGDAVNRDEEVSRTLIDNNMRVQHLSVERINTSNSFKINLVLSTEDLNDFDTFGVDASCTVVTGDEFCYVARLETVVTARN